MTTRPSYWGVAVAAVYTAFAVSTLGLVAFAMTMPVDLVSVDYYERALVEDRKIEATQNARALGAAIAVTVDSVARQLVVRLPSSGATGTVTLYRPSRSASDKTIALALMEGRQVVDLAGLSTGRWLVQIAWTSGDRPYYYEAGVQLP